MISDEDDLKRAIELERAVITINRIDFIKLHKVDDEHAGIVVCTFDADFIGQASRIDKACKKFNEIRSQLVRVYRPS